MLISFVYWVSRAFRDQHVKRAHWMQALAMEQHEEISVAIGVDALNKDWTAYWMNSWIFFRSKDKSSMIFGRCPQAYFRIENDSELSFRLILKLPEDFFLIWGKKNPDVTSGFLLWELTGSNRRPSACKADFNMFCDVYTWLDI